MSDFKLMKYKLEQKKKELDKRKNMSFIERMVDNDKKRKPAPSKLDKALKKLGYETTDERMEKARILKEIEYNELPLEKKQKFLDLFLKEGKTFGESYEIAGISFDMATEIIKQNTVDASYIASKVIK